MLKLKLKTNISTVVMKKKVSVEWVRAQLYARTQICNSNEHGRIYVDTCTFVENDLKIEATWGPFLFITKQPYFYWMLKEINYIKTELLSISLFKEYLMLEAVPEKDLPTLLYSFKHKEINDLLIEAIKKGKRVLYDN